MRSTSDFLKYIGCKKVPPVRENMSIGELTEIALSKDEAVLSKNGVLTAYTGKYTGRSPKDKFTVERPEYKDVINWGSSNRPISSEKFEGIYAKVRAHIETLPEVFVFEGSAGADAASAIPVRIITEYAWHSFFASLLMRKEKVAGANEEDIFTIIDVPGCLAEGEKDGVNSEAFVLVDFLNRLVLIGGTKYAGEIKKSVFSYLNYLLPQKGVLSMHCSATAGAKGDVALYFGLSGTGKTTLSADASRKLLGDDEHGWSANGVFNIEGGCYAKCINLDPEKEPQIYSAIKAGAVVENVVIKKESGEYDFTDNSLTENTRVAYPLEFIGTREPSAKGGHPTNIFFLTADAFGVLPPISRLSKEQALYYFLCGYTSKLAGTERGIAEPQANFSLFFGEPFMPLRSEYYLALFKKLITDHKVSVYLVNTGWTGGGYGVGKRMSLPHTRALIDAVLKGTLGRASFEKEAFFGLEIPTACDNVPTEVLNPMNAWKDRGAYESKAKELVGLFEQNYAKYADVLKKVI
jgi:phosphoenolpyruvate carboxykinase (ATP)